MGTFLLMLTVAVAAGALNAWADNVPRGARRSDLTVVEALEAVGVALLLATSATSIVLAMAKLGGWS